MNYKLHTTHTHIFFLPYFFFNVYLFTLRERERESTLVSKGGTEGEGERESQAGSTLSTEPDMGLNLMTGRSQPEPISRVQGLTN